MEFRLRYPGKTDISLASRFLCSGDILTLFYSRDHNRLHYGREIDPNEGSFALLPDAEINYEILGKGKPVIFLHGMGLDCRMWDDQVSALSTTFQEMRYNLRGFGRSSLPSDKSYAHHKDLRESLSQLHIQRATQVGLSMGGRVAIDSAITYPSLLSLIVLVDSASQGFTYKTYSTRELTTIAERSGAEQAKRAWFNHELFDSARRNPVVADHLSRIIDSYSAWHWLNRNPWEPIEPPAIEQLHRIKAPNLLITGRKTFRISRKSPISLSQKSPGRKRLWYLGPGTSVIWKPAGIQQIPVRISSGIRFTRLKHAAGRWRAFC